MIDPEDFLNKFLYFLYQIFMKIMVFSALNPFGDRGDRISVYSSHTLIEYISYKNEGFMV